MPPVVPAAKNADLYKEINERIKRLEEPYESGAPIGFICECTCTNCTAVIYVSLSEYAAVRADPEHFVRLPEHVDPESESIVREADRFAVIERTRDSTASATTA